MENYASCILNLQFHTLKNVAFAGDGALARYFVLCLILAP
jgi:hypothetical protein